MKDDPTTLDTVPSGHEPTELEAKPGEDDATTLESTDELTTRIRHRLPEPLEERYEALRLLSSDGSEADVYLCQDRADGSEVAVKLYRSHRIDFDPTVVEAVHGADRGHVVPTVFDSWNGEHWEVQEFMLLGTLAELPTRLGRRLSIGELEQLTDELVEAVAHIHHDLHLLHRDLKPTNILVRSVDPMDVVLSDFGLSRVLLAGAEEGSRSRTPGYASPEALVGEHDLTSDWWSLGITLLEAFTGRHPFSDTQGRRWPEAAIYAHLMNNDVDLTGVDDERWRLLFRGLLTKRGSDRWSAEQARAWLRGESPTVRTTTQQQAHGWSYAGLLDRTVTSLPELGDLMADNWAAAANHLTGRGATALENSLAETSVEGASTSAFDRYRRNLIGLDVLVFELISLLVPQRPASYRGVDLGPEGLAGIADRASAGDPEAAEWIRRMRSDHVLERTQRHPQYAELVAIDALLTRWWDSMAQNRDDAISAQQTAMQSSGTGLSRQDADDVAARFAASRDRFEGELLKCALSEPYRSRTHQVVLDEAPTAKQPTWLADLEVRAETDQPDDLGLVLLITVLRQSAAADAELLSRTRSSISQRDRQQRAAERQRDFRAGLVQRRRQATSSAFRTFWVSVPFLGIVAMAAVPWDVPGYGGGDLWTAVQPLAIVCALVIAGRWLSDTFLGRATGVPGLVATSLGFTGGWFAWGSNGSAESLPTGTFIGYLVGAGVCAALLENPDLRRRFLERSSSSHRRLRDAAHAVVALTVALVPLSIIQAFSFVSDWNHEKVHESMRTLYVDAWPWFQDVMDWLDGTSRLGPEYQAVWVVPAVAVVAYVRIFDGGPSTRRGALVILSVAPVLVLALIHQWAVVVLTGAIAAMAVGVFATAIFIAVSWAG